MSNSSFANLTIKHVHGDTMTGGSSLLLRGGYCDCWYQSWKANAEGDLVSKVGEIKHSVDFDL